MPPAHDRGHGGTSGNWLGSQRQDSTAEAPPSSRPLTSSRPKPDPRTGVQKWAKFYLGDWRSAVSRFSPTTERHALHLYMASIEQQGPLRDVPRVVCKILGVGRSHWYRVRIELIEGRFIQIHGDTIVVPLAQKAIDSYQRRSTVNRRNALARYRDDIEEAE